MPREGGLVLAVNHFAFIDVPVVGTLCPRRIVFVAKNELFDDARPLGQLIRAHGTLAVRRGESDRDALRRMREAVRNGEVLGLFVEGTRQRERRAGGGEAGRGAWWRSRRACRSCPPRSTARRPGWSATARRSRIAFGEPMRFAEQPRNSKGYAAATQEIQAEIYRLWEFLIRMHELGRPKGAVPPRREKVPARVS